MQPSWLRARRAGRSSLFQFRRSRFERWNSGVMVQPGKALVNENHISRLCLGIEDRTAQRECPCVQLFSFCPYRCV